MRNIIFRIAAGLLGLGCLWTTFNAVVDRNIMGIVYLLVGSLFIIFALGGYKAAAWADYYLNKTFNNVVDLFRKK